MAKNNTPQSRFDDETVFWGAMIGFIIGAVVWFFNVPARGIVARQRLRNAPDELREQLAQQDAVTNSIEEGKQIARRRRFTED